MPDAMHPSPSPFPYPQDPATQPPPPPPIEPFGSPSHAWAQVPYVAPPPPPPRKRRGWPFFAIWFAVGILAMGLILQAVAFAFTAVSDILEESSALSNPGRTVLSEPWDVDGVDVVYVEEGGSPCETEFCWEWLLMTEPACASPTVTIEISESLFGEADRTVKRPVTTENVTSVIVETLEGDGDYAELTAIACE